MNSHSPTHRTKKNNNTSGKEKYNRKNIIYKIAIDLLIKLFVSEGIHTNTHAHKNKSGFTCNLIVPLLYYGVKVQKKLIIITYPSDFWEDTL